jgi:hypothetical protein
MLARIAVRTPCPSAATSIRIVCSRAWMSDRNDSRRLATNFTGRPSVKRGAGGHVVLIDVDLDAEAPADVGRDDAHALLAKAEQVREHRLHHVRHLCGDPHRERARGGLVVGEQASRLERHAGVPARRERALPDARSGGEGALDVSRAEPRLVEHVVAELGVDQRRAGRERRVRREHRGSGSYSTPISAAASSAAARVSAAMATIGSPT